MYVPRRGHMSTTLDRGTEGNLEGQFIVNSEANIGLCLVMQGKWLNKG